MTTKELEKLFDTVGDLITLALDLGRTGRLSASGADVLLDRLCSWEGDLYEQLDEKYRRSRRR